MKILIVSQYFWPETFRINDLALGLIKEGVEVEVLTGKPNYPKGKFFQGYGYWNKSVEYWNGIKIRRSNLIPRGSAGGVRLAINYLSFLGFGSLKAFTINKKFDAVLVFGTSPVTSCIPAIVYAKKQKIPLYFWVQDLWPESVSATGMVKNQFLINRLNGLTKWIYKNCDKLLIQSKGFQQYILNQGVDIKKLIYFPNWAEDLYKPISAADRSGEPLLNYPGFKLLFAGNIGAAQNLELVLDAIKLVVEQNEMFHFYIVGDGRQRELVIKKISQLSLQNHVHLMGAFPTEEMPRFFSEADTLLVSLKDESIFNLTIPSKLQSYLACGKPVIGFLKGEGANVIEEANAGLVVPSDDYKLLAHRLLELSKMDQKALQKTGENGLNYYNEVFNRKKLLAKLIEIFKAGDNNRCDV